MRHSCGLIVEKAQERINFWRELLIKEKGEVNESFFREVLRSEQAYKKSYEGAHDRDNMGLCGFYISEEELKSIYG